MVLKRGFERIKNVIECKTYIEKENNPENKEQFVYGFKHIKTDKINFYILIGCESVEIYKNDKLINFWSNKFVNQEIEKRDFKITGCSLRP